MNTTANLGKAPVRTLVLQLAIPSMTAQFVNVLYSIIDRMYIGHISENGALALAGAGICGPIVTLLTSFGTLVGIGGSITMGIHSSSVGSYRSPCFVYNFFRNVYFFFMGSDPGVLEADPRQPKLRSSKVYLGLPRTLCFPAYPGSTCRQV